MKIIRHICLLFAAVFLCGCSSAPTIYLYAKYLDSEQQQQIVDKLSPKFNVEINQFEFPDNIESSTLIYSPLIESRAAIIETETLLGEIGWHNLQLDTLVARNHWFTKESIGVLLIPEHQQYQQKRQLTQLLQQYQSNDCDTEYILKINANGSYQLKLKNEPLVDIHQGVWRFDNPPYLQLSKGADEHTWWYYFVVSHSTASDKVSEIALTGLKSVEPYKFFNNCSFQYGERVIPMVIKD